MSGKKIPPYFKIYEEEAKIFEKISDELAGKYLKAACKFHLTGEVVEFDDALERAIWENLQEKLTRGQAEYVLTCERNKANRNKKT